MLEVVSWFVIYFVTHLLDCYVFSKLVKQKFKLEFKIIIISLIFAVIDSISGIYNGLMKFIVTNLLTFVILKIIYKENVSKTLIGTLFIYLGYVVSELIFTIIFIVLLTIKPEFFLENYFALLFVNIFEFIIYILLFKIKSVLNLVFKIMNWFDKNKKIDLIVTSILAIIICYTVLYPLIYNKDLITYDFFLICILVGAIVFIVGYFKEKSGNNKLTIEYAQLLDYVKTYEDEVVDKSKKQHEYKNQLIIIDDMIPKTNKKAKEYLKKVLNNVEGITDNDWLVKLKNLPSGGIKGLVHFKIKKMLENKISVYVDVDKKLSKKDNWVSVEKNLEDISRILGVYLDNAIEAASKANDRQIIIEFINKEDNIEFVLSNSYSGNISFAEIDKEGYSTKGKNRGVGLSLVKDIIKNNKLLSQSREINGKFYVQKLYIKK